MKAWRRVCGPIFLASPARRATRRTILAAPCRSSRLRSRGGEARSFAAFADGQVDRAGGPRRERDNGFPAALAGNRQGPVAALGAQSLDVRAGGLGHARPVQASSEIGGVGLAMHARPADVGGWGVVEQVLLDRVPVEFGDGGQPPGTVARCPAALTAAQLSASPGRLAPSRPTR